MPIQYPQRQGLNLGAVQLQTSGTAVQAVQGNTQVSPDVAQAAAGKAANAAALSDALASGMTGLVESMRKNYAAQAKFDVTQKQLDDQKADNFIAGDIYRKSAAQSAAFALLGDYSAQREAKLAERATSMPYEQAVAMDRQDLADIQKQLKPHLALMGAEATDALSNQFQQLLAMQSKEAAVKSAEHSIAKASQALDANILGNVPTLMQALNVGDSGAVDQIVQNARTVIDSAEYIPEAQRKQKLQALFLNAGATASSSYELNQLMQAASKHLGMDGVAVMNALEGNRTKASLTERIELENSLNVDTSEMTTEERTAYYNTVEQRIAQSVREGTYSVEQGANMQMQARKALSAGTALQAQESLLTSGAPLGAVATAMGVTAEKVYKATVEKLPLEQKLSWAQSAQANRDSTGFALAMKDIGSGYKDELTLMLGSSGNELSTEQLQKLGQLDTMKQQNPAMVETMLSQMGDEGTDLRKLMQFQTVGPQSLQMLREQNLQAKALKDSGYTPKERNELISDAAGSAIPWLSENSSFLSGVFNRADWNQQAAEAITSELFADASPEDRRSGGSALIAQRAQDRLMTITLASKRGVQSGVVTTDRGVSLRSYVQQLGLANKEDLANIISTHFSAFRDTLQDASIQSPKILRDGSVEYRIVNNNGDTETATISAADMQRTAAELMQARAERNDDYLKNQAKLRPLVVDGETVLMQGTDFNVGNTKVSGNWVVEAGQMLLEHEGFKRDVYLDTLGNPTWGIGMTKASGVAPQEANTPAKATAKLQQLIQGNYGKQAVEAANQYGVPMNKPMFVLLTDVAYQGPSSAKALAKSIGQFTRGQATKADVLAALAATPAYKAAGAGRQQTRENMLIRALNDLDDRRKAQVLAEKR